MELTAPTPTPGAAFGLGDALMVYLPFFIGLLAFTLIILAFVPKLSKAVRILFGIAGGVLLLWALWFFVFRTMLL